VKPQLWELSLQRFDGRLIFSFLKADQQRAGMSESSAPPMGGDGFNLCLFIPYLVPAHQLIYGIPIYSHFLLLPYHNLNTYPIIIICK
jgi:hypothetical protein